MNSPEDPAAVNAVGTRAGPVFTEAELEDHLRFGWAKESFRTFEVSNIRNVYRKSVGWTRFEI